jgi:hypothetical protein
MHRACGRGTGPQQCRPSCSDSIVCTHRRPSARPSQAPTTRCSPARNRAGKCLSFTYCSAPAHSAQHHPCAAGYRRHPLTAQAQPVHAAYFLGPATSAASSARDSVPATLPHHLRFDCLHAPPPPRLAPRKQHHPLQPCAQTTAARSMQHHPCRAGRRSQPPAHSAAAADARSVQRRFRNVSCAILPRLGASDAAPSSPI